MTTTAPKQVGYTRDAEGRIVSNGCRCEYSTASGGTDGMKIVGGWNAKNCPLHRSKEKP